MAEDVNDRLNRYLQDAIALEGSLVAGLKDMASEATTPEDAQMFEMHRAQTESQKERLEQCLHARGGHHNKIKEVLNAIGVAATDLLHGGKDAPDKAVRNLMQAYAIENLEVAVYEGLYAAAMAAGDQQTARVAKEIQAEEQATAQKVFARIAPLSAPAAHGATPAMAGV
jgi:ferritin-like metal-binding protein YciE